MLILLHEQKNRKYIEKTIIDVIAENNTKTGWKIVSKLAM